MYMELQQLEFIPIFLFGLVSSLHCLGMCGPIVVAYSGHLAAGHQRGLFSAATMAHLLYNLGRITTYALVGALMGGLGKALNMGLRLVGIQNAVTLIGGIVLLSLGVMHLGLLPRISVLSENVLFKIQRLRGLLQRLMAPDNLAGKYVLGVFLGFIPCMLTYAMFIRAMATESPAQGFWVLLVFGLGTVPMLFAVGMGSSLMTQRMKRWGNRVAAVSILILGLLLVFRAVKRMQKGPMPAGHSYGHAAVVKPMDGCLQVKASDGIGEERFA
ncbi:MAG: sulfite exporter TauE/SafE family protein [candidate division KSB1 bacterium]|nr:sulfite exporter TauE/SafE family protein [candidate division KSB1 bacterium]